jgi:hypothetical protein
MPRGSETLPALRRVATMVILIALALPLPDHEASAKIQCDGDYQITGGRSVSTPYCGAENLARVAQSRGIQTSAAAIRADYGTLKRVCMALHGDSRVTNTCQLFTEAPF